MDRPLGEFSSMRSIFLLFFLMNGSMAIGLESLSLGSRDAGMFSIFFDVLDLLKSYDKGRFHSIEVDFRNEGHYYDAKKGPDWWGYYFEPIKLGPEGRKQRIYGCTQYVNPYNIEYRTTRRKAYHLIDTYIQIKPDIQKDIDDYEAREFAEHFVIGLHYRGTDKRSEAPPVPYKKVVDVVYAEVLKHRNDNVRIYVATDEQQFLNYMISQFGDLVCYYPDAIRSVSGKALHYDPKHSSYQVGREALIDCVLLSRTDTLIRTSSNLSLCSTFFNPDLQVKELSKRWNR